MTRENPGGDAIGTLLLLGGAGAILYYLYSQGFFASFMGSPAGSPAVGTNLATGTPAAGSTGTPAAGSTGTPAGGGTPTATWAGPTLDQMYAATLAAEQAAMSASVPDPALTCVGVTSSSTVVSTRPGVSTVPVGGGSIAVRPNAPRTAITGTPSALSGLGAASCAMPQATYDVHNWYLVNRANSGITAGPEPPDHTTVVSLADYWTWAAPLLKAAHPGLAGGFGRGLGAYAELGRLMQMQRGY